MRKFIALAVTLFFFNVLNISAAFSAAPEAKVSIADKTAAQGEAVAIDIKVENSAKDIIGIDLWIKYDPRILEVKNVVKGSLTASGAIVSNLEEPGAVKIALFSVEPFSCCKGSLATINFIVKKAALPGTQSVLSFSKAQFNGKPVLAGRLSSGKLKIVVALSEKHKRR